MVPKATLNFLKGESRKGEGCLLEQHKGAIPSSILMNVLFLYCRKYHRQSASAPQRPNDNVSPHPSSSSSAYGSGTESLHQHDDDDDVDYDVETSDDETTKAGALDSPLSNAARGGCGGNGGKKKNYRSTAFSNVTPMKNQSVRIPLYKVEFKTFTRNPK